MNNVAYVRLLLDCFPASVLAGGEIASMEIHYAAPCFEGEELSVLCRREGSIRQELTTAEVVEELVTLHRGMLFEWRIYEGGFPLAQRGRRMAEHLLEGMRG